MMSETVGIDIHEIESQYVKFIVNKWRFYLNSLSLFRRKIVLNGGYNHIGVIWVVFRKILPKIGKVGIAEVCMGLGDVTTARDVHRIYKSSLAFPIHTGAVWEREDLILTNLSAVSEKML